MNAIVVLNLHDFMPPQPRASFEHAAARWGCKYIEITDPLSKAHHFWQKAVVPLSTYVAGCDRVLQLDGDMLVRSDCPSPFELVPAETFGAVSRIQPGARPRLFAGRKAKWARWMRIEPYVEEHRHLNAGLLLYSFPHHLELLREWLAIGAMCGWSVRCPVPDQFALSCLLQMRNTPVTWLPWTFNTIRAGHHRHAPPGPMATYVYHFNGPRGRNLPAAVAKCEWRVP